MDKALNPRLKDSRLKDSRSCWALCLALCALGLALVSAACASVPAPRPEPRVVTWEDKLSWMMRLEDQRILRDPDPPPPVVLAPATPTQPAVVEPAQPSDLIRLLNDTEARVRRRAALALGRVGLSEAVEPLTGLLGDEVPEVRQMAAFSLGLIGAADARPALLAALGDGDPEVQGRAAEALGMMGRSRRCHGGQRNGARIHRRRRAGGRGRGRSGVSPGACGRGGAPWPVRAGAAGVVRRAGGGRARPDRPARLELVAGVLCDPAARGSRASRRRSSRS